MLIKLADYPLNVPVERTRLTGVERLWELKILEALQTTKGMLPEGTVLADVEVQISATRPVSIHKYKTPVTVTMSKATEPMTASKMVGGQNYKMRDGREITYTGKFHFNGDMVVHAVGETDPQALFVISPYEPVEPLP